MARPPRLGGELPTYNTMSAKPKKPRKTANFQALMTPMGSSKYVQRSPKISLGMPGTKNFVQRTPGGAHQPKPGAGGMGRVMKALQSTVRSKLAAPRKPAK